MPSTPIKPGCRLPPAARPTDWLFPAEGGREYLRPSSLGRGQKLLPKSAFAQTVNCTWRNRTGPVHIVHCGETPLPARGRGRGYPPAVARSCSTWLWQQRAPSRTAMDQDSGLDVSLKETSISMRQNRKRIWRWPSACRIQRRSLERSGSTRRMCRR
jgi:hypothetical protein